MRKQYISKSLYILILAISLSGILTNGFDGVLPVHAANAKRLAASTTIGAGTYNDTDGAWTYDGKWATAKTKKAYKGQLHISKNKNENASIQIDGEAFALIYTADNKEGMLDIYVDDSKIATLDQHKSKTAYKNKWTSPLLGPGSHSIKFVHVDKKKINIDGIIVSAPEQKNLDPTPTPTSKMTDTPEPRSSVQDASAQQSIYIQIKAPTSSGTSYTSSQNTPFEAVAWDPNIGTSNGSGIDNVTFSFSGPSPISSHKENSPTYCAWGGDDPCDTMPSDTYNTLISGTYTMYVIATASSGATATASTTFVILRAAAPSPTPTDIPAKMPAPTSTSINLLANSSTSAPGTIKQTLYIEISSPKPNGETLATNSDTAFEAIIWDPHGADISNVVFSFNGPTSIPSHQENYTDYCAWGSDHPCYAMPSDTHNTLTSGAYIRRDYCVWGGDGPCQAMPSDIYTTLAPGSYTMHVTATASDGATATASTTFVIPVAAAAPPPPAGTPTNTPVSTSAPSNLPAYTPTSTPEVPIQQPIHIEITYPNTENNTITSNSSTSFEAVAWDPNVGTANSVGISNVVFSFSGPIPIPSHQEDSAAYCAWGGNGPCNPMPSDLYNALTPGTYTMYVTASASSGGTATVSTTFMIPDTTSSTTDTYYVDGSNGSDTNSGTQSQPWQTIQKAAQNAAPGNTIIVEAGSYPERISIGRSGTSNAPITFQASGSVVTQGFTVKADYITIKGFEITNTPNTDVDGVGIFVQGSYCDIENNYVHYATRGGILLNSSQSTNCTVRNNKLYRNSQYGIELYGQNHLIENNEIWGTIQYHPKWTNPPSWVDADGIRFFGSGHVFRGNYIHDISLSDPQNIDPHMDAFQTWTDSGAPAGNHCIFEQNIVQLYGPNTAGLQLEGGVHDLVIRNNLITAFSGVKIYESGGNTPNNIFVLNNLINGSLAYSADSYPEGVSVENVGGNLVIVENNIFTEQRGQTIWSVSSPGLNADYNLFYNSDGSTPTGTSQPHDLWNVNPLFVNPANGDYHLQADSPAIDAGIASSNVANDFDGVIRPQGTGVDIGPFEYH